MKNTERLLRDLDESLNVTDEECNAFAEMLDQLDSGKNLTPEQVTKIETVAARLGIK